MKAATVNGPRTRMTSSSASAVLNASLLFPHRHEDLSLALAPHENLRETSRGHPLQLPAGLGGGRHALPVDRENHVTLSEGAGRRTVRVDFGDESPRLPRRHVQLPRPLRRQVAERETEALAPLV